MRIDKKTNKWQRKEHMNIQFLFVIISMSFILLSVYSSIALADIVFSENFDDGWKEWYTDFGVWEIGETDGNPVRKCAATSLKGYYVHNTDSRLISPKIQLPVINTNEELMIHFWHFFNYSSGDYGEIHVKVYENNNWGKWESILRATSANSLIWAPKHVNLSKYSGKLIQIAFFHFENNNGYNYPGWYIDDLEIVKKEKKIFDTTFIEDFENGWQEWSTDYGVWEIGKCDDAHSGNNCGITIRGGYYPHNTDSLLISPIVQLPVVNTGEDILVSFWQSFVYSSGDYGEVWIQAFENNEWSNWQIVKRVTSLNSDGWTPSRIDITEYMGKQIQLGFYHFENNNGYNSWGWAIDDIQFIVPTTCKIDVTPKTFSFDSNPGTGQINITSSDDCNWVAKANNDWITITTEKTGKGNATLSFSVTKNSDTNSRQGSLSINGNVIEILQDGISCHYTISSTEVSIESSGGQFTIDIETESTCPWNVSTSTEWISIVSKASGRGHSTITFSAEQNTSKTQRTGTIRIEDQTVTVFQNALSECKYQLSDQLKHVDESGGQFNVNITTLETCNWNTSKNVDWITIVSGSNGTGNGNIEFTVQANSVVYSRTGEIKIADQNLMIIQDGKKCLINLSETIHYVDTSGGIYLINIDTSNGCSWEALSTVDWIVITSGKNGTGKGVVQYSVTENKGTDTRTGVIRINGLSFTVIQSCCDTQLAGIAIDMIVATSDIEPSVCVSDNSDFWIALKAHDVSKLDTYQIELNYDPKRIAFIEGLEDDNANNMTNILKKNNGTTLGFMANEIEPGVIQIVNSLVSTDCNKAPNGSGLLALIHFQFIDYNQEEPTYLFLSNVSFKDCHDYIQKINNLKSGQILSCDAGAALDTDITTYFYDDTITATAIEYSKYVLLNEKVLIGVVAQGTSNLDTYEVKVSFDNNRLKFIQGYEEYMNDIYEIRNILKKYGGTTLGFRAIIVDDGVINMANTLVGKVKDKAPDGSGIMGILEFEILDKQSTEPIKINLDEVTYVNSVEEKEFIDNLSHAELLPNSCLKWDFNCDGIVNFLDLGLFADNWLFTCDHPGWSPKYDSVQDCIINFLDLGEFADHWLEKKTCSCKCSNM